MRRPSDCERFRCSACGNLTRFDVVETTTVRRFFHYTIAGELRIDGEEELAGQFESVTCRWCSATTSVEIVPAVRPAGGSGGSSQARPRQSAGTAALPGAELRTPESESE